MHKILFVATIFRHFSAFHKPYIRWLKENGWQVDIVAGGDDVEFDCIDKKFRIDIQRTPFSFKNIIAYKQAKKIIETGNYDIIYCHTAMGSVIARTAAYKYHKTGRTKIVYVAHGFHFFKGGPIKNWIIYYPIEKFLSKYTDAIVTINQEDYNLIKNHGFKNLATYKIDGIGINADRFFVANSEQKAIIRAKNNIKNEEFVLIYIAEFITRKNHRFIVNTVPELCNKIPNLKVLFAGRGKLMEKMKEYANNLGIGSHINFLGFRSDIPELLAISDLGISSSLQEGLGLNLIEEMFAGIPVVATQDRGHREIVNNGENGFLFQQNNRKEFVEKVVLLYEHPEIRKKLGGNAVNSVQKFRMENAIEKMSEIFDKTISKYSV